MCAWRGQWTEGSVRVSVPFLPRVPQTASAERAGPVAVPTAVPQGLCS